MKKFLTAFASVATAFASNAMPTSASVATHVSTTDDQKVATPHAVVLGENITTIDSKGDQFNFVLRKSSETGQMMAWHESHSSHASHSSHSSHYSSRY